MNQTSTKQTDKQRTQHSIVGLKKWPSSILTLVQKHKCIISNNTYEIKGVNDNKRELPLSLQVTITWTCFSEINVDYLITEQIEQSKQKEAFKGSRKGQK